MLAKQSSQSTIPVHNGVCFHCQQCAEKYLKALLEEVGLNVPKTHDLETLMNSLKSHYPALRSLLRGINFLSGFAIRVRYPGKNASKRQEMAAVRWMDRIRTEACALLKIRERHVMP